MSSVLTDLRAALDAKQEAEAEHRLARRGNDHDEKVAAAECVNRAIDDLGSLLTDDTIAALIDVAEAAEAKSHCPFCGVMLHLEIAWSTPHWPYCPLAPLVKEATDE